jgi:NAD-dependent SIR2 family protein deacetylase
VCRHSGQLVTFQEFDFSSVMTSAFELAAEIIAKADALVIAAGAGMGVDSGLPDFRGAEGFWKAYPALGRDNLSFHRIACPMAFLDRPTRAWGFYGHRLNLYRKTVPHAGFDILRKWGEEMPLGYRVYTSNVDGQFQKAGFPQEVIHECHGSILHVQCMNDCDSGVWSADEFVPQVDDETCTLLNSPPVCPKCGGMARPNVMMFSDWGWEQRRSEAQRCREEIWLESIADRNARIVVVELGGGTDIPSVRYFSERLIFEFGARLVRINPKEFSVPSDLDVGLANTAGHALAEIDRVVETGKSGGSRGHADAKSK